MTQAEEILAAVAGGAETLSQITDWVGIEGNRVSGILSALARSNAVYRTTMRDPTRAYKTVFRYRIPNAPDVLAERREAAERMKGWVPYESLSS